MFWFVLALAIGLGGARAVSGMPILAGMLLPPGSMAAEAGADPHPASVTFPVEIAESGRPYSPQILQAGPGFPPWLTARVAFARAGDAAGAGVTPHSAPAIAIVIDDLGADAIGTRRAIALPKDVSLSFLPYPDMAPEFAREGLRAGHQIIVHVPMEPSGRSDPGPMALRTDLSAAENNTRLDWALARIAGFSGINNHEGSKFTADREALVPVIEHLQERHVFFLDSRTTPTTSVVPLARAFGVPSAGRDIFLDDVQTAAAIDAELIHAENAAKEQGVVIAIGHPHAATMDALAKWTASAASRGFELITASEAIRRKTDREALSGSLTNSLAAAR
ncbi:MAG TPA: divergent polysaccharide deacetylase family protein [Rhizomicrobium sp.]